MASEQGIPLNQLEVHKFGGASVQDAEGLIRASRLIRERANRPLLVVVSAMGKTTSALDTVSRLSWEKQPDEASKVLEAIEEHHRRAVQELGIPESDPVQKEISRVFEAILLRVKNPDGTLYDRYYDAIVHQGEVLATQLLCACLRRDGASPIWHDARELIQTDSTYREARLHLESSYRAIVSQIGGVPGIHVVQGFIGSAENGDPVTLGLEGSDFSAALFAEALGAESVTLWKNVPGVFSADPAHFTDATPLPQLSYREVFQMANYGAKVIHPKTMQPLERSGIPLRVRSFLEPQQEGTDIGSEDPKSPYPAIRVKLEDIVLISLHINDLSYFTERHIHTLFQDLNRHRAKALLTEIGLIHFSVAVQISPEKREPLFATLQQGFRVRYNDGLTLLTIRHGKAQDALFPTSNREILLEQHNRQTRQYLYRET